MKRKHTCIECAMKTRVGATQSATSHTCHKCTQTQIERLNPL